MYINLTAGELSALIDALNGVIESREIESGCTQDEDILEANNNAIDEANALINNLWSQMENPVEKLSVAVEVQGGLIQAVYANADIFADVYDLDVSDYPDPGEREAVDKLEANLRELVSSPGWHTIY